MNGEDSQCNATKPSEAATLLAGINAIADELCAVVDGNVDISISTDSDDETLQKLTMLVNFVLGVAHRAVKKSEARELQLAINEQYLRAILQAEPECVAVIERDGTLRDMNPAGVVMFEADSVEQIRSHGLAHFVTPLFRDAFHSLHEGAVAGTSGKLTLEATGLKGTKKWLDTHVVPLSNNENVAAVLAVTRDITDRCLKESQLRLTLDNLQCERMRIEHYAAELQRKNAMLDEARREADAANRSKSEFLANMSHEIRTPMTAILGYAELLLEEGDLSKAPEKRVEAIQTVLRNGTHLLAIINDILDLSKIEAGKLSIESIQCPVEAIVNDVVSLMQVRAQAKGIQLRMAYETAVPAAVAGDPTRLRQILMNLLGNAIKFTDLGTAQLLVRYIGDEFPRLEFDVVDTGIGISEEQRASLFKPFGQADASTTRKFGGSGLGLTISQRLAALMGGDVFMVESALNVGTRFRFVLPVAPLIGSPSISLVSIEHAGVLACPIAHSATPKHVLNGSRILLAEDGPDNQKLISFVLKKAGAAVTVVENGRLAVESALQAVDEDQPFHVILMDMQMPIWDGYSATAELRSAGYKGTIIALTAHAMSGDRDKCLAAGCDEYATKPIDRAKLINQVANYYLSQQELLVTS